MANKKNNELRVIQKYNPNAIVRVSSNMYDLEQCLLNLPIHGFRMLFALSYNIKENDLFREYMISKKVIFKLLGLENTNRRYEILVNMLEQLRQSGLKIRTVNPKNNKRTWAASSWITGYTVSEEYDNIKITLNDDALPYLFNVKQYAQISPINYLKLSSSYQTYFYPLFKKALPLGHWYITIDDIRLGLDLKDKSYDKQQCKNATQNILKWILGIEMSPEAKEEAALAKKERRKPNLVPWNYTKDKNGNPNGTLATISRETDIDVKACVIKEGRSFNKVFFLISSKEGSASKTSYSKPGNNSKGVTDAVIIDDDMGRPQDVRNRNVSDEFSIAAAAKKVKVEPYFHEREEIEQMARESFMTFEDLIKYSKFVLHENGKYYRP